MTTREFPIFFYTGRIPPNQLVISLFGIKRPQFFNLNLFGGVHCLSHSTNLPWKYSTRLIIYYQKQAVRNITNEILAVKGPGIVVFWNSVVVFAFYNRHFIILLDSVIRMSDFDSLV